MLLAYKKQDAFQKAGSCFALHFEPDWVEMEQSSALIMPTCIAAKTRGFGVQCRLLIAASLLCSERPGLSAEGPTEYQIKSAFIFNFAKFVEWPSDTFESKNSPLVIGVLGDNPFHDDLEKVIRNKTVEEHPVRIKFLKTAAEGTNCQVVFISTSEKPRLVQTLRELRAGHVLTVGEMDQFTESGGIINFVFEREKIRFKINSEAAAAAGIKVSSKLLNLATR